MYRITILLVLFVSCGMEFVLAWDNEYDQPLRMECSSSEAIYAIISQHDSGKEDRRWSFGCRRHALLMDGQQCEWHNSVNQYDGILDFTCPSGRIITGVGSVHDSNKEDRIWDYRCCGADSTSLCDHANTALTRYINDYDGYMDWHTEHDIIGFYSTHDSHYEDRKWKVRTGQLDCVSACACPDTFNNDWEIIDVTYELNQFDLSGEQDVTLATRIINNPSTTATLSTEFRVTETVTETSSYSHSIGVSITTGVSFTAKIPFIGDLTTSLELSTSYSHTWGTTTSTARAVTSSFRVTVPPMGRVRAKGIITRSTIENVPYTMFLRHKSLYCECMSKGMWNGVQHHNLFLSAEDIDNTATIASTSQRDHGVGSGASAFDTGSRTVAGISAIGIIVTRLIGLDVKA